MDLPDEPPRKPRGDLPSTTAFVWPADGRLPEMPGQTDALRLKIHLAEDQKGLLRFLLNADFGSHELPSSHWVDCAETKYRMEFGITGGHLFTRLRNGRASAARRLGQVKIPAKLSEQETVQSERLQERTASSSVKAGFSLKAFFGEFFGTRSTKSEEKAARTKSRTVNIPIVEPSGPEDEPRWKFTSPIEGVCLRGLAPGGGNPPLALVEVDRQPVEAVAAFVVEAKDLKVIGVGALEFDESAVATAAVAQKALPKELEGYFDTMGGRLLLAGGKATFPAAPDEHSGLILRGEGR